MFVAMGNYTDANATQFAAAVGMTLVDGEELLRIIGTGPDGEILELPVPSPVSAPPRPACGSAMVRRTARQGPRAGLDFWGGSMFPACRGTAAIPDEVSVAL